MKIKVSNSYKVFTVINTVLLVSLSILTIYPFLYVIFGSISDGNELIKHSGIMLKPLGEINFDAYKTVFNNRNIWVGYQNTFLLLLFGTVYQVMLTAVGAYVLSRKKVMWNNVIMFFIVFTMFFSGGMIPLYLQVRALNLRDSLFSVVLPFSINVYNLIIMRTSFNEIPVSLEESAKLDGASHITIFTRIILPLSKPVIAVMLLYYGVELWNGWFWATIFISDRSKFPLQVILREILISNDPSALADATTSDMDRIGVAETIKYATIVVATAPILFVYPFIQKYFAKGVMIGAVKG